MFYDHANRAPMRCDIEKAGNKYTASLQASYRRKHVKVGARVISDVHDELCCAVWGELCRDQRNLRMHKDRHTHTYTRAPHHTLQYRQPRLDRWMQTIGYNTVTNYTRTREAGTPCEICAIRADKVILPVRTRVDTSMMFTSTRGVQDSPHFPWSYTLCHARYTGCTITRSNSSLEAPKCEEEDAR